MGSLDDIRKKINEIDNTLVELIAQRIELGKEVAAAKDKEDQVFFQPAREQQVLKRVSEKNPGVIDNARLQNVFREIMGATLDIQRSLKIAYLGPAGTFTHQAALKKFGHSIPLEPCKDFQEVFDLVQKGKAHYGILPIENSIEGIVNTTLDHLLKYDLNIYSEVHLAIHNNLMGTAGDLSQIKTVYSHPQPFGQCREWLLHHLPHAEYCETSSTSQASRIVAEKKDPSVASIASIAAAEAYNLPVIEKNIEDFERNYTRFIIISKTTAAVSENDRTSVIFATSDKPGSLFEMLRPIDEAGVNMTSLESRPSRLEPWSYYFYVDFLGHHESEPLKSALQKIREKTNFFRILGSYPVDQDFA